MTKDDMITSYSGLLVAFSDPHLYCSCYPRSKDQFWRHSSPLQAQRGHIEPLSKTQRNVAKFSGKESVMTRYYMLLHVIMYQFKGKRGITWIFCQGWRLHRTKIAMGEDAEKPQPRDGLLRKAHSWGA
jgi:hypothetical protein